MEKKQIINKYRADIIKQYISKPNIIMIQSSTTAALADRELRTMINTLLPIKVKLTGKIKTKIFEQFNSKALASETILIVIDNYNLQPTWIDFNDIKEKYQLIIKAYIWDKHFIDINEENYYIYDYFCNFHKNIILFGLIFILKILVVLFDLISLNVCIFNCYMFNKNN